MSFSLSEMRRDTAQVLREADDAIGDDDNLVDWGLDSIRLMLLRQRWIDRGVELPFAELAERPQLSHWWTLVRRAGLGDAPRD